MQNRLSRTLPQKPSSGKCLIAVQPDVYTALRAVAVMRGMTLGALVKELASR